MLPAIALLLLLNCSPIAQAAPAPIVFDFEDGLQGWELGGSAQRVQTQILGGEWAIFGDGLTPAPAKGAFMLIDIDLTGIAAISVEQFFAGDPIFGIDFLVIAIGCPLGCPPGALTSFLTSSPDPTANPGFRTFFLEPEFREPRTVALWWSFRNRPLPPLRDAALGFLDNITFHPVPEPSTLALLAFGLVALVIARRRMM